MADNVIMCVVGCEVEWRAQSAHLLFVENVEASSLRFSVAREGKRDVKLETHVHIGEEPPQFARSAALHCTRLFLVSPHCHLVTVSTTQHSYDTEIFPE